MTRAKTNNKKISQSDDKKISRALMASYVVLTIQYFILISFNLMDTESGARVQLLSKLLVGLFFLHALPVVMKKGKIMLIGVYSFSIFLFVLHFWFFSESRIYLGEISFSYFLMCVPAFVYSMCLSDWNVLKENMKKASWIVFGFGTIAGIQIVLSGAIAGTYSMALSYYLLLPAILLMDELFEKFSLKALIGTFVSILVILALGARGAIVCIAVFIVLKMIRPHSKLYYKEIFFYLVAVGSTMLVLFNIKRILVSLNDLLLTFGVQSRSLMLLLNQEEIHLSGREHIYQDVVEEISNHPIVGVGLGGDRVGGLGYSHNLFLEIGANFGVIIGGMISMVLIILIVRSFFLKKEKNNMVMIWLCLGFVHLMVSGSYLTEMKFWILLGLLVNVHFFVPSKGESIYAQKKNHHRYDLKYHRYGSAHHDSSTRHLTGYRHETR